jgi:hypothetical protein
MILHISFTCNGGTSKNGLPLPVGKPKRVKGLSSTTTSLIASLQFFHSAFEHKREWKDCIEDPLTFRYLST